MVRMSQVMERFVREDDAATMPEYALMVAFIALVCIAAVTLVGGNVNGRFGQLAADLAG